MEVERYAVEFIAAAGCPHDSLFDANYERANRLHAVKILRCFPHCCPHHVKRSYCGSPLHVQVTRQECRKDSSHLQVFSHFCDSSTPGHRVGDTFALSAFRGSLQCKENTNGEWISSELIGSVDSKTMLFEVNPSKRWYYAWRSTRRNQDRLRTHVLEALVVLADEATGAARVLAVVVSPPFTITSFRRSSPEMATNEIRPLTALEASLVDLIAASPTEVPPERAMIQQTVARRPISSSAHLVDDAKQFQTELAWLFMAIPEIRLPHVRQLVSQWQDYQSTNVYPGILTTTKENLVSSVAWWLCMDPSVHEAYEHHAAQASETFHDLDGLGRIYSDWMRWLRAHIDEFLQPAGISWRVVVTTLALEHDKTQLGGGQSQRTPHGFDWENFVAHARQYALLNTRERNSHEFLTKTDSWWTTRLSAVKVLPARTTRTNAADHRLVYVQDLAVDSLIAFTLQLSRIMLTMDSSSSAPTMEICSMVHDQFNNENQRREATRLVLDGHYRSFNSLPHGESALCAGSVLGGQCFGDYVGVVNAESQRVEAVCFSWPTDLWRRAHPTTEDSVDSVAYQWSWNLPLSFVDAETVVVEAEVSTASVVGVGNEGLACESVVSRLGRVEGEWEEAYRVRCTYCRATSTIGASHADMATP